ncbi:hypothetical protein AOXY_G20793 [Acipenser oxyrinchus oxyrinchus]|uniref:Uncharacterized protein n=1 Tax=Acipenser oxyrinchus oxyrinchus TaxID=40147 RepID=A0AAD8CET7_ACIOX|nr:hypothetical protein AOXY_G38270 [Acipenser oxyrinchus oxyrinchus]KAK1160543.1 hypothetical protein AOXY_G20793 [Acipenser oxyrinchus oxyrinchus]
MAGCELRGELKYRNGDTKQFLVKAETNIKSILSGLQQLKDEVSVVLSDLVIQEKSENPHSRNGNDVSEDENEGDDEEEIKPKTKASSLEPPAKRTKNLQV